MKRIILLIVIVAMSISVFVSCKKKVTDVSLSIVCITLFTLVATVSPADATNKDVEWSSSNPNVAMVTNGVVNAKSEGLAIITVTTKDGKKTATCKTTVVSSPGK